MAFTAVPVTTKATVSYYSGRQMVVRGFRVVASSGRTCRNFIQGTAQKWTPELESTLRAQAEEWAETLNRRAAA